MIGPHPVTLVEDLQRGERQAFVRFYELYRQPVYNLVLTLTHGSDETPSIVRDVFITSYRQMLLSTGPIELTPWVFRVTVMACEDYLSDGGPESPGEEDQDLAAEEAQIAAASQWQEGDLSSRFAQALDALTARHQAALLLTDVYALHVDEIALVFGLSRDAARSLLFRARETFRQAFADLSTQHAAPACALAEQAAAASVGRSLGSDEERKLREHAGYCRTCRRTMKAWPVGVTGLALFLTDVPVPAALEAAPVFAPAPVPVTAVEKPRKAAAGVVIPLNRALRRTGEVVTSKAAAYAVAAVCLAATVGMALYVTGLDTMTGPQSSLFSAQRPAPHAVRHAGKAAIVPVAPGSGQISGEAYELATTTGETLPTAIVLASTSGQPADGGAKRAGSTGGGPAGGSGGTVSPQPGGTTGTVGSGDTNGKGQAKTKPAGKAVGQGKTAKPKPGKGNGKGGGQGGGNGKATKPVKSKPIQKTQKSAPAKPKASKPSKPKASKPKQTKQTGKPSNTQN